jgi:molybdopterin-guanine dinucleotide biosynthesis protein A
MTDTPIPPTLGLVLAGGLARRMGGGDKARLTIGGVTILDRVLATLSAQCTGIIINANGDPARFADTGLEVVPDNVPGDCPFLPEDLVERLHQARRKMGAGVPLACARSGEWRHPVVGLWPLALRENLRKALVDEDLRKIEVWTARHGIAIADWPDRPVDPFFNVNTPDDAARAEQAAAQMAGG